MSDQSASPDALVSSGNRSETRYPLHVTLAAVFVTILLVFGGAIIAFNYVEGRRMALETADDLMKRIGAHLRSNISELYQPVRGLVDLAAQGRLLEDASLDSRLRALEALAQLLRRHPALTSVYAGYDNGELFLVRALENRPETRRRLDAPAGSRFAVQSYDHAESGAALGALLFYDDELELLEERPWEAVFDPREREWYRAAILTDEQITTDFYRFFTTGEIGLTFARRTADGSAVVAADLALDDLSAGLARQRVTASTRLAIIGEGGSVIALSDPSPTLPAGRAVENGEKVRLSRLAESSEPVFLELGKRFDSIDSSIRFEFETDGRSWFASFLPLPTRGSDDVYLAIAIPVDELLAATGKIRDNSILISLVLLALAVAAVYWISRRVSGSLRDLARHAENIRRFKLAAPISVESRILEVDDLASTMSLMKSTLQRFFDISRALSAEKDEKRLMEMILREAVKVSNADGGAILMTSEDEEQLEVAILENERTGAYFGGTSGEPPTMPPIPLGEAESDHGAPGIGSESARRGVTLRVDDVEAEKSLDLTSVRSRFAADGYRLNSLLSVPLSDQKDDLVGLLQLVNAREDSGEPGEFDPEIESYIEALAANAAVALDLRRLLRAQKDLLDSFILVVAGAIDAKSPYTHGHCRRVPVIAEMLARAAHESSEGPFADFRLSDDEWYELHISSWLHDCGKVTTPEYVVDKATRLESLDNRLNEVRMRFEVLWRDAEIDYLRSVAESEADRESLRSQLESHLESLREDFAFVAECNLGETFMDEERIARLRRVGSRSWLRHLDDRIGLSHEEQARKERAPDQDLPVEEALLADKPEHILERKTEGEAFGDNPHGFRMEVPEHLYNRGELYNLSIPRGTLTAEERFKINEHIVETINMLGKLPFPRELSRVPDWAGNHHEKLDGTGYPRRLEAADLSIPERIMALADVFEALTATDRPYMRPKSLSTALRILRSMCDSGHLCPDLYELLLRSGVFRDYGAQYLNPDQLDEVDVDSYL